MADEKKTEADWFDKTLGRAARAGAAKVTCGASEIAGVGKPIEDFVTEQSRKGQERYDKLSPEEKRQIDYWRTRSF
ncbi:hypothetical protein ACIBCM_09755 [Streptomyces sp. NPDC051018]|uniref:hypothetical protein n=1 Tax=Streptomyces sp. NPDC051018 TaxID=3365639 RepID=UPI00378CB0ED